MSLSNFPAPKRITASNLPLAQSQAAADASAEPAVEVKVDTLQPEPLMGVFGRARIATHKTVPVSNDGHGEIPLDDVPGVGIVMPGGLNMYYLDIAPRTEGVMHRTTSTDYLIVLRGTLSLITPPEPFTVADNKGTYKQTTETLCHPGDTVVQRGMMHALTNRTDEWIRLVAFVVASDANKVPIEGAAQQEKKQLDDAWLP